MVTVILVGARYPLAYEVLRGHMRIFLGAQRLLEGVEFEEAFKPTASAPSLVFFAHRSPPAPR